MINIFLFKAKLKIFFKMIAMVLVDGLKKYFVDFTVFTLSFLCFFISSVGLYNSLDTPQFFTTQAIIENQNLNLVPFSHDPHFFVHPDIFILKEQILGVRGYLTSLMALPLHFFSHFFSEFLSVKNFPVAVITPNFKYELFITASFSIFTSLGLLFLINSFKVLNIKKFLILVLPLLFAFGTYSWKYSSAYTRHGLSVLLICAFFNYLVKFYKKNRKTNLRNLLLVTSLCFGVDIFLFITFVLVLLVLFLSLNLRELIRKNLALFKASVLVILLLVIGNIIAYQSIFSSQTMKQVTVLAEMGNDSRRAWLSTPLFPTVPAVLFNIKKIPAEAFTNFERLPEEIAKFCSVSFAKKMDFYGIFFVSPFLLFSFLGFFLKLKKTKKQLFLLSFIGFLIGIALNSKVLNFWGGNQYDIRYFYPYSYFLAISLGLTLDFFIKSYNNQLIKGMTFFIFLVSAIFSVFMGWLGVINMFKPSLTGERKIFLTFWEFARHFRSYTFVNYLNATFLNRENYLLPLMISFVLFFVFILVKTIFFTRVVDK